jgi:hypothetical protein
LDLVQKGQRFDQASSTAHDDHGPARDEVLTLEKAGWSCPVAIRPS